MHKLASEEGLQGKHFCAKPAAITCDGELMDRLQEACRPIAGAVDRLRRQVWLGPSVFLTTLFTALSSGFFQSRLLHAWN